MKVTCTPWRAQTCFCSSLWVAHVKQEEQQCRIWWHVHLLPAYVHWNKISLGIITPKYWTFKNTQSYGMKQIFVAWDVSGMQFCFRFFFCNQLLNLSDFQLLIKLFKILKSLMIYCCLFIHSQTLLYFC